MAADVFSWLHLTDLHFGLPGQRHLWPNLRGPFLDDLAELHDRCGPWDAVFFTGDLTQQGTSDEFAEMQAEVLDRLWMKLTELGSGDAVLLAVPGNHDLYRPNTMQEDNPAAERLIEDPFDKLADRFWDRSTGAYRKVIDHAFAAYTEWWQNTPNRPADLTPGLLPGDFAATLDRRGRKIGVVGLNTAFLQLAGGDYTNRLVWDARQLHTICGGAADDWTKKHDLCLLLTHHGPDWLTPAARKHGDTEIAPPGRFALHLYGHMHATEMQTLHRGGDHRAVRRWQGLSLFGMEHYGDPPTQRRDHGFTAGRVDFSGVHPTARCWPRRATDKPAGWRLVPDNEAAILTDDAATHPETLILTLPHRHAAPAAVPAAPAPMPVAALEKFVGRAEQLADLAAALLPPSGKAQAAVVCNLQGMAGVGKSFLVERFVQLNGDRFIGGYKKIPLGDAEQPTAESLLQSIAERLGLKPSPDDLLARVQMALEHRPHLLHIDNLDTPAQAQAAAELVERLPSTPLILTGRHTFADAGGWRVVPVAPFAVDEALQQLNHELGEGRAMAEPEADKRALVTELGGLPLAISLAGSYLHGGRSIRTFLERYRQKLLDIEPYHPNSKSYQDSTRKALRSLAATFNLSIDALRERLGADADAGLPALCALGVAPLVGARIGWLAAITGVGETQAEDWLDKALTLSIVQHDPETRRWRVHKLLSEHLRQHTDAEAATARMDAWMLERLPAAPDDTRGARWGALQAEHEAVAEWVAGLDGARAVLGGWIGYDYARVSGPYAAWLGAVARGLDATDDAEARSALLWRQANLALQAGDLDLAVSAAEAKGAHDAVQGWDREMALTAALRSDLHQARGQFDEALRIRREEVLPVFERLGDAYSQAATMGKIADVLQARGQLDEALRLRREEALPVYERLGDVRSKAVTLGQIADVLQARGQLDEAMWIRREEELPVYERLGDVRGRAITMGKIADVHQARGQLDEALRIRREEVFPVYERLGDVRNKAVTLGKIADVLQARGQLDEALRIRREEELPVYKRLGDVRDKAVTMSKIADVLQARGQLDEALRIQREEVLPVVEWLGDMHGKAVTLGKIADVLQAQRQPDEALRILREEVLPITEALGDRHGLLIDQTSLAISLLLTRKLKHRDEARALLTTALKSAEDLNFPNEAKQIRSMFPRFNLRLPT